MCFLLISVTHSEILKRIELKKKKVKQLQCTTNRSEVKKSNILKFILSKILDSNKYTNLGC